MRIAWVTPLVLRSHIGRFSASVTAELASRGHSVRLIRSESPFDPAEPTHPTELETVHFREVDMDALRAETDLVILNLGDNYLFHAGVFPMLEAFPCLAVFHDFFLMDLYNGWADRRRASPEDYRAGITDTYGPETEGLAERANAYALDLDTIAAKLPMTEWFARRCAGALAHAEFYADRTRSACTGPVAVAHLTASSRGVAPLPARGERPVVVTTVGVMNPNKCADHVIQAIAASPMLRRRARYHLVGPISPREQGRLEGLASEGGYEGLSIFGAVDDETLEHQLEKSDIICCLRKPVLEGASGSVIEALLSGRPTVVADAGFYGELPDDMVFKVPAEAPQAALVATLEALVEDEALRRRAGGRAAAWARDYFAVGRYVDALEAVARKTVDGLPLMTLGKHIGDELTGFGLASDDPSVTRIAGAVGAMFPSLSRDR